MATFHPLLPLLLLLGGLAPAFAQSVKKTVPPPFVVPPDVNGMKSIIPAPVQTREITVGIYCGPGSPRGGVDNVLNVLRPFPKVKAVVLSGQEVGGLNISTYDVLVFPGGSGSGQSKGIGAAGLKNVRDFVRNGGGYVGICGGAYLACSNFTWGLGILNAGTVSNKWRRGQALLDLEPTPAGQQWLGDVKSTFKVRYHNGPILTPAHRADIPAYNVVTVFKTEIAEYGAPAGVQVNSPAHVISTYGKGRVFISSPHPENTPGLENFIPRGIFWSAGDETLPAVD